MAIPRIKPNFKLTLKMPGASNSVTAGNEALFKFPTVYRYHMLYLIFSGVALAEMNEIRLLCNGKVIHRYSGVERNRMNQFDGLQDAATTGILPIPLDRQDLLSRIARETTAINCGVPAIEGRPNTAINSFHLEVDIDAAATAPKIDVHASVSLPVAGGPGDILRVVKTSRTCNAPKHEIADISSLGTEEGMVLNRAFFFGSNITAVQLKRNTDTLFEVPKALNEMIQTDGIRKPQANLTVVDTTAEGYGANVTDVAPSDDLRFILDLSATEDLDILVEQVGKLGQ